MPNVCQNTHNRGAIGEQLACEYLEKKGYSIIERNYRIREGEIDIVAKDGGDIVFIEVKLRNSVVFGYPEEAVGDTKLKRIVKTIKTYLHSERTKYSCIRFDIISIVCDNSLSTIRHIENIELPYEVC